MKDKSVIEMASELLKKYNNSLAKLAEKQTASSFTSIKGIAGDKAASLLAVFEIARRVLSSEKNILNKKLTEPKLVADFFIPLLKDEVVEKFIVVCLNSANKITKYEIISSGILDGTVIHAREVFKAAIENNARSIILVHNHPSENTEPSKDDIATTRKLSEAGRVMDIPVIDHLIIGGNAYTSFKEMKLL